MSSQDTSLRILFLCSGAEVANFPLDRVNKIIATITDFRDNVELSYITATDAPIAASTLSVRESPSIVVLHNDTAIYQVTDATEEKVYDELRKVLPLSDMDVAVNMKIIRLINLAPVMVFIKGSPEEPRCKFSRQLLELLKDLGVSYGSFDVLSDESVRRGLVKFANWTTYPQVWVEGHFIGGLDVVTEIKESGQIESVFPASCFATKPMNETPNSPPAHASAHAPAPAPKFELTDELRHKLKKLVESAAVIVIMNGSPSAPDDDASKELVEILRANNITFKALDVLKAPSARHGFKTMYTNRDYPFLFVHGALFGGIHDVHEVMEKNPGVPLAELLEVQSEVKETLNERLKRLTNAAKVVLFCKGMPTAPRCGFSRTAFSLLAELGINLDAAVNADEAANDPSMNVQFAYFDILEDNEVREGLKKFSDWATYPQLYVDGTLVGGLDIMNELHQEGELADLLRG